MATCAARRLEPVGVVLITNVGTKIREREREREKRERERGREGEIIRDNVNHYTKPACQLLTPQPAFYCYGAKPRQRCVTDVMAQGK